METKKKEGKITGHLLSIFNRVKLPIIIGIASFILLFSIQLSKNTLQLLLYKTILICFAVTLAHILRVTFYPYIDLSDLIRQDKKNLQLPEALRFVGACILVAGLTFAIIYGFTFGL